MNYPKEILVYVCDHDKDEPVYAVARNLSEIPESCDQEKVAVYLKQQQPTFRVRRELK